MAQLKDSVVQGSLRVTDTLYTNDISISASKTAHYVLAAPTANGAPTFRALVASDIPTLGATQIPALSTTHIPTISITGGTTGTLTVARGGTGLTTSTNKNAVIIGNSTTPANAFQAVRTNSGAFYATAQDGAPTFGTLPIAQGGTGLTTADPHKVLIGPATGTAAAAPTWRQLIYPDIAPTISKIYAPANSHGTADNDASCAFFFLSVKPDSWYKGWQIKFKVRTVADSYANVDSTTWCTLNGRADSYIYHNWNERYDIGHYYITGRFLKQAGFNAGLGHMVGISVRYSTGRGTAAYSRKIHLDYYECEGCTVTVLDSANLWANLGNTTNYSDTNYNGYVNMNAVDRGLRETGDDNSTSISTLYEQYGGWVAANLLCRYQLIFETADHKFVSIFGTDNAYNTTNKTLLTVDFDPNGRIFYHNTSGTTAANANIDSGRLYYAVLADLRYSFNVTSTASSSTFTGVRYTSLYLKTQMTAATGMVHVASNQPLVTTLPTTNDGYYYIYLGQVHDWYRVMMTGEHPVYYHDGTKIVQYVNVSAKTISDTLPVNKGGTGVTSITASQLLVGNGTAAITTRAIKNNTGNTSPAASTDIPTMNTLYYGLAKINNADQNHGVSVYAPTAGGTAGYILTAAGATTTPSWKEILPVANGGTGVKTLTANSILVSGANTTAAITTRAITNNTSNAAITSGTNIPTMNTIYYGLVTVNGNSQSRATNIFVPTTTGSSGQYLKSNGSGAPSWQTPTALIASNISANAVNTYTNVQSILDNLNTRVNNVSSSASIISASVTAMQTNVSQAQSSIIDIQNQTNTQIISPDENLALPAAGSTTSIDMPGLTEYHRLIYWRFSHSPENAPPVSLTWTTYNGYFTIQTTLGSTTETVRPIFAQPLFKSVTAHA